MELLTRVHKWRNGECGNCKMALAQIMADTEDVLTSLEQLVGAARVYRGIVNSPHADAELVKAARDRVVLAALITEDKING